MKPNNQPFIRPQLSLSLIFFLLGFIQMQQTYAQAVISPIYSDVNAASLASTGPAPINCDMVEDYNGSGNTLSAIVWWDVVGGVSFARLHVTYSGGGSTTITLPPNSYEPDVAIGYYSQKEPVLCGYYINVVYWDLVPAGTNHIMLAQYCVAIGAGTIAVSSVGSPTTIRTPSTTGPIFNSPHIDLFADKSQSIGSSGLPALHKFANSI